jgi:hypothetical protein
MTDRQIVDKVKDALHGDDNNDVRITSCIVTKAN